MYFTTAKFNSRCTETGTRISKGDKILYDRENKKVYGFTSQRFKTYKEGQDMSTFFTLLKMYGDCTTITEEEYNLL